MAIGLAALGLLAFLLGCSGTFAEPQNSKSRVQCSLTGRWLNDLGSRMEIYSVSPSGVFSGDFLTAVSISGNPVPLSPLQGIQHQGLQPTFGFAVSLIATESTIVFVGQCLVDDNGREQLRTTWLLREKVESPAEDWKTTRVGPNIFYSIR